MATNKRKKAVAATIAAAALLLGGTFAWTSISQQALNETIVDINPGGRLHDDFNGSTLDVYVENFNDADDPKAVPVYARIKLTEYMEVGQEAGKKDIPDGERKALAIGGGTLTDTDSWDTYLPTEDTITNESNVYSKYWNWTMGNDSTDGRYYMPTFNKNKDSLEADVNGTYEGTVEDDIVHYDDFVLYEADSEVTADATYDWDDDTIDEGDPDYGQEPTNRENETDPWDSADQYQETETHKAQLLDSTAEIMTMKAWLELPEEEQVGPYWVYDTDGWAYWAQPIEPGETTGLLMDGINMKRVPDDNWYYGINAIGQFITRSDLGQSNGTGFYTDGQIPSADAHELLKKIGVDVKPPTYTALNWADDTVLAQDIPSGSSFDVYPGMSVELSSSDNSRKWSASGLNDESYIDDTFLWVSESEPVGTVITLTHKAYDGKEYSIYANVVQEPASVTLGYSNKYYANAVNNAECEQDSTYDYSTNHFDGEVTVMLCDENGEEVSGAVDADGGYIKFPAGYDKHYVLTATDGTTTVSINVEIFDEYKVFADGRLTEYNNICVEKGETCQFCIYKNDDYDTNLASEVEWSLESNTSSDTRVEAGLLTIGEDETSGDVWVNASGEIEGDAFDFSQKVHPLSGVLTPTFETNEKIAEITVPRVDGKYVVPVDDMGFSDFESVTFISADREPSSLAGLTMTLGQFGGKNVIVIHVDADYIYQSQPYGEFTFTDPKSDIRLRVNFSNGENQ